jgi:hypothetical protein
MKKRNKRKRRKMEIRRGRNGVYNTEIGDRERLSRGQNDDDGREAEPTFYPVRELVGAWTPGLACSPRTRPEVQITNHYITLTDIIDY